MDATKAKEMVGWTPAVPLRDGIELTADWMRSNLTFLEGVPLEYTHKP